MAGTEHLDPTFSAKASSMASDRSTGQPSWQWHISTLERSDGCKIRYGICRRGQKPISRYLVFLTGRSEWIEKYEYLPTELGLPDTTAVLSLDHRGQGESGGCRAYIDSYDTYADDLVAVLAASGADSKPFDILSHSMGGLIALTAYTKGKIHPEQMILSAPLLRLPNTTLPHYVMKPLMNLLTKAKMVKLDKLELASGSDKTATPANSVLTTWPWALKQIRESEYPLSFVTPSWVNATFKAIEWLFTKEALEEFATPVTVFKAGKEQVVNNRGLDAWQRHCKVNQVAIDVVTFPDAQHEILNERFDHRHSALDCARRLLSKQPVGS